MGVDRRLLPQGTEDVDLAWRVIDVVVTPNDVRNGHVDVIHHDAEVIGRSAIRSGYHQVIEFVIADLDAALDLVLPDHRAGLRILEAQHRLHTNRNRWQCLSRCRAPGAVIAWLFLGGHLVLTQSIQFGNAHVTGVNVTCGL